MRNKSVSSKTHVNEQRSTSLVKRANMVPGVGTVRDKHL